MYCQRCGRELAPGAAYCQNCGAKVGEYSPAEWWWERRRERWERHEWRHEWDPMDAAWGAIRGVGYLVVIGLTIFAYPDVFTLLIKYLESWGTFGHPVLPPYALGQPIIFLFTGGGIWGILSSGLRLAFSSRVRRPLRGVVSGAFSLYFAFILNRFYAKAFHGAALVLLFFVGLAVMVLVNAIISHLLPRRRTPEQAPKT